MIFIPGDVPSSKNSKIKTASGVFNSKAVRKYLQNIGVKNFSSSKKTVEEYKTRPNLFRQSVGQYFYSSGYPVFVGFHFVRKTKMKFDFHNMCQIIADLLVAHDFIQDDDIEHFIPVPLKLHGQWWSYDKENPGVFLQKMGED